MRGLRVVGLAEDGAFVVCEDSNGERFRLPADEQLRAASRGDATRLGQIAIELESQMRPREIQARIRSGESVEHIAHVSSIPVQRVERFAYPVLLERVRTAELAQQAHPVREDGPDVQTLTEMAAYAFGQWGQDYTAASWDSWRGDDGRWVVQLSWKAGRSENRAHWAFSPGAHGGTVTPLDEHAEHVMDPRSHRGLRTVGAPVPLPAKPKARDTEILAKEAEEPEQQNSPQRRAVARSIAQRPTSSKPVPDIADEQEDDTVDPESLWYAEPIPAGDPILQPPVELVTNPVEEEPSAEDERTQQAEQPTPRNTPQRPGPRRNTATAQQTTEPAQRPARAQATETAQSPTPARPTTQPQRVTGTAQPQRSATTAQAQRSTTTAQPQRSAATAQSQRAAGVTQAQNAAAAQPTLDQEPANPTPNTPAASHESQEAAEPKPESQSEAQPRKATGRTPKRGKKNHPAVPSWEDVLLGVRSNR